MGNGASPAASGQHGLLGFFWCCTVDRDGEVVHGVEFPNEASSGQHKAHAWQRVASAPSDATADAKKSNADIVDDADAEATTADTGTPARNTPQSASKDAPADFGGSWLCVSVTGDMESFLIDMGLAEGARRAASVARYGALRQMQNIAQSGDTFVVENILDKPVTMRFCVGEGVQKTADQEGKPIFIEPVWDGEVLCVASKRESGELIANSRRYIEGADMILELRSPSGTVVRRKFQRRICFT